MNLHELDLPSEVTHLIRLFVGPHPCAKMVRDFFEDIEYDKHESEMSFVEYVNYLNEREIRLRIFCIHETLARLVEDRPNGTFISTDTLLNGLRPPVQNLREDATLWGVHDLSRPPESLV